MVLKDERCRVYDRIRPAALKVPFRRGLAVVTSGLRHETLLSAKVKSRLRLVKVQLNFALT
jgi:hypothetical protein